MGAFLDGEREHDSVAPAPRAIGGPDTPPLSGIVFNDVAAVNALRR